VNRLFIHNELHVAKSKARTTMKILLRLFFLLTVALITAAILRSMV
jgi:hypothetical protein